MTLLHAYSGTQCWLGSHLETAAANAGGHDISLPELAELRRETHPPIQLTVPKGACAFRDLRVWHRGMPNRGEIPRHMISLGRPTSNLQLPVACDGWVYFDRSLVMYGSIVDRLLV